MQAKNFYDALRELDRAGSFRDWVAAEYGDSCYRLYEAFNGEGEIYNYRINALYTNYAILRSDLWDILGEFDGFDGDCTPHELIPERAVNLALGYIANEIYLEKLDALRGILDITDGLYLFHLDEVFNDLTEREKDLIIEYCENEPDTLQNLLDCNTPMGLQVDVLVRIITLENII